MSDPAAAIPDDLTARRVATSLAWTVESNWDGDEWIGSTMPPWGSKNRCPAIRSGKRCRKACIPGGTVCATHGGAAPQVKRRAKLRALQLLDPALGQLARILANPSDQRVGLAAVKMVIDMNGVGQKNDVDSTLAKAILMDRHYALQQAAAKAAAEAVAGELEGEVEEPEYADEVTDDEAELPAEQSQVDDERTQAEIDDDDELLYNPAAALEFEQAQLAAENEGDDDYDPFDTGPGDSIVTFPSALHHHNESDSSASLS